MLKKKKKEKKMETSFWKLVSKLFNFFMALQMVVVDSPIFENRFQKDFQGEQVKFSDALSRTSAVNKDGWLELLILCTVSQNLLTICNVVNLLGNLDWKFHIKFYLFGKNVL